MKPFHPTQSRRLYRAISAAAAAQARAEFAGRRAESAAAFKPAADPAHARAEKALAAAAQASISANIAQELAARADWTTGESSDIDTAGAEHAAQQAKRHAARAVSLAAHATRPE